MAMRIDLSHVGKRFGRIAALSDVNVAIPAGRRVALIGPNGSGKSTLIRAILGIIACEGDVRVDGQSPVLRRSELARRLAYVPQIAPQLGATVGDLVRCVAELRALDPESIIAFGERLSVDLGGLRGRPFRDLSGGTRHKVLLAMALSTGASLFILDEPTASLDFEARARFFRLYEEVAAGATLLLCSHRLEEVRSLVDHVVALEDGRLVYDGAAEMLLARCSLSVVELQVGPGGDDHWAATHGFHAGLGGWWSRAVNPSEKLGLIAGATSALGGRLRNLIVRDLETVRLPSSGGQDG